MNFSSQTFGKHAESVLVLMELEGPVGPGLATQTGHQPGRPSRNKEDTFCSLYATAQKAGGILSIKDGQGPAPGPVRSAGSEDWPGQCLLFTRVVPPIAAHPAHRPATPTTPTTHRPQLSPPTILRSSHRSPRPITALALWPRPSLLATPTTYHARLHGWRSPLLPPAPPATHTAHH